MKNMKLFFFTLLIISLLLKFSFLADAFVSAPTPAPVEGSCDAKCKVRCSEAGYYKRCYDYCYICCNKCNKCVPSGPRANKSECPCYRDMLNSKGKSKCP